MDTRTAFLNADIDEIILGQQLHAFEKLGGQRYLLFETYEIFLWIRTVLQNMVLSN